MHSSRILENQADSQSEREVHKTQAYFNAAVMSAPSVPPESGITLNTTNAASLQLYLQDDARNYVYSSAVSIADAVQAIDRELYSWSTVKLYYALFYALRAILAANSLAIIYHNNGRKNTPYLLRCCQGQRPVKLSGNTHKIVIKEFCNVFPDSPLLSQMIEFRRPFDWMMDRREEVNYKNVRFSEPLVPDFFRGVIKSSMRLTVAAYVNDVSSTYAFDPDHAILALPIKVLSIAARSIVETNPKLKFSEEDQAYIFSLFRDQHGIFKVAEKIFI